jgi:hypothetical protein
MSARQHSELAFHVPSRCVVSIEQLALTFGGSQGARQVKSLLILGNRFLERDRVASRVIWAWAD